MATITEHIPGCVERDPDPPVEFSTQEELMAVPFVSQWTALPGFIRFVRDHEALIAHMRDGPWVVGFADPPSALDHIPPFSTTGAR